MTKISNNGIVKMSVKVSNAEDTARNYDISAQVWVNDKNEVENIEDGAVLKDGQTVATFARFAGNAHKTFIGLTLDEEAQVSAEIKSFIEGTQTFATTIAL